MKKITSLTLVICLLSSCAPKPVVVTVVEAEDTRLDCTQIYSAIQTAQQYKIAARAEDRFRLRYIFPPTGFLAMYRFIEAEGAAIRRIKHLETIAKGKKCDEAVQNQNPKLINPQMLEFPQGQNYIPENGYYQDNGGQQPYAPQGQQYAPQEQQYAPQGQQYAPQGQQYAPQGQQYAPQGQQYAPQEQQYAPQGQQYAPQMQQQYYAPQEQQYAPQGQPYAPQTQQQHYAPPRQQLAPPEQDFGPDDSGMDAL